MDSFNATKLSIEKKKLESKLMVWSICCLFLLYWVYFFCFIYISLSFLFIFSFPLFLVPLSSFLSFLYPLPHSLLLLLLFLFVLCLSFNHYIYLSIYIYISSFISFFLFCSFFYSFTHFILFSFFLFLSFSSQHSAELAGLTEETHIHNSKEREKEKKKKKEKKKRERERRAQQRLHSAEKKHRHSTHRQTKPLSSAHDQCTAQFTPRKYSQHCRRNKENCVSVFNTLEMELPHVSAEVNVVCVQSEHTQRPHTVSESASRHSQLSSMRRKKRCVLFFFFYSHASATPLRNSAHTEAALHKTQNQMDEREQKLTQTHRHTHEYLRHCSISIFMIAVKAILTHTELLIVLNLISL